MSRFLINGAAKWGQFTQEVNNSSYTAGVTAKDGPRKPIPKPVAVNKTASGKAPVIYTASTARFTT